MTRRTVAAAVLAVLAVLVAARAAVAWLADWHSLDCPAAWSGSTHTVGGGL